MTHDADASPSREAFLVRYARDSDQASGWGRLFQAGTSGIGHTKDLRCGFRFSSLGALKVVARLSQKRRARPPK